jgi:hypothetical protein
MRVSNARERSDRTRRGTLQPLGIVAEHLGRVTAVIEVELCIGFVGNLLVHSEDLTLDDCLEGGLCVRYCCGGIGHETFQSLETQEITGHYYAPFGLMF